MCQCVSLSEGTYIFLGGEREDSSPKLRDARALRSISTSPACENGNAPCTLGRWWGTWCDGIEGVMFIPRWAGGISKKVGFMLEPFARPEGCPIHSGNYSWFVKSGIFVKKPDGSSCCKTSHNQMYCKKKSGQTYSNNTKLPTSPTLSNLFFMDRWCFIHKPTLAEMAVSKSWVVGRMQISKF